MTWAEDNWAEIDGKLLMKGVDLLELPLDRALNVLYALLMSTAVDEKDRYKIESTLHRPLPGQVKHDQDDNDLWDHAADDGAAFMAAMTQQNTLLGNS